MYEDVEMPEGMNPEVLEHLMSPKNYGKLENPSGVGVALDEKTKEYVIFYILLEQGLLKDVKFATNGCQDTVVIGSMFSDMIINNDLDYASTAITKMHTKLGQLSAQQQICADIVFSSFTASIRNYENKESGADEELHLFKMKDSCEATGQEEQTHE